MFFKKDKYMTYHKDNEKVNAEFIKNNSDKHFCCFCGRSNLQVKRMVSGPAKCKPAICDLCIKVCTELIENSDEAIIERPKKQ